ncbi:MAG: tetratricopeptide repeat protein, partial [Symploca sp. SIO1C4]|nr:tetratricopeptide repeat protein [Symploca sp. SIO1C4]
MHKLIKYTVSVIGLISIWGSGRTLATSTVPQTSDKLPEQVDNREQRNRRETDEKNNRIIKGVFPTDSGTLEQQAQQLYEMGQAAEAVNILKQAITNYTERGDLNGQVIALSNLTLVYQQLGAWQQAEQAISDALNLLPEIANIKERQRLLAQTLDAQGQLLLSLGQPEQALDIWKQAADTYQEIGELTGFTRSKIYQAQALQALGLYAKAIKTLTSIQEQLKSEPDTL